MEIFQNLKTKISFVIPCYNSASILEKMVLELYKVIETLPDISSYEIILVNDASKDNTIEVIQKLCAGDVNIIGIDLTKNRGQHSAIMAGLSYSTGDFVFSIDDDGQMPVDSIPDMLEEIRKGHDVVCAHFIKRLSRSLFRRFGTWLNIKIRDALLEIPKGMYVTIFFVARRFVVDEILKYKNPYPYLTGLIFRVTDNIGNVETVQKKRVSGASGYTLKKLFSLWINGFTAFSIKPLRISTVLGLISSVTGIIVAIILIINKLIDPQYVAGWVSTIATTLIIGGIIMFMLGLVGEYIGRIYMSINESPQYVVRDVINGKKANDDSFQ